jgi:hypothetical protein
MSRLGLKPMIPVFEQSKKLRALEYAVHVIDRRVSLVQKLKNFVYSK